MIAKIVRESFHNSMGMALDLIRMTDIGERQLRQLEITLKNGFNDSIVNLLSALEAQGIIRKCECLEMVLAARDSTINPEEKRAYHEAKKNCQKCEGSGYVDTYGVPSNG